MNAALFCGDDLWLPAWQEGRGEHTLKYRMTVQDPELILYSSWFCPFAQRAWIAAEEKCVNYRWEEINPYQVDPRQPGGYTKKQLPLAEKKMLYPQFVQASPKGLVPAVQCGDELLAESQPIIEYIDLKFQSSAPRLCSDDPYERARTRIWADYANDKIQRPYYRMLVEQSEEARQLAYADLIEGCKTFSRAMAPATQGPFFMGDRFSYTDVSFAPFFQRILVVGSHYRQISLPQDDADITRLMHWWDACKNRKSIANTLVSSERLISSYSNYAENKATSDFAQGLMSSLSASTRASSSLAATAAAKNVAASPSVILSLTAFTGFLAGLAIGMIARRPSS
mmetsp:Transcript_14852/g.18308  ORF Transcript_14852/g.18308 Transcript_14852/m.18308 type:complete len:340 (+) Transcript_14852:2-1021(+)